MRPKKYSGDAKERFSMTRAIYEEEVHGRALRSAERKWKLFDETLIGSEANTENEAFNNITAQQMKDLFDQLPDREAYVLRAIILDGHTKVAVAQQLRVTDTTVNDILKKAKSNFRNGPGRKFITEISNW